MRRNILGGCDDIPVEVNKRTSCVSQTSFDSHFMHPKEILQILAFFLIGYNNYFILPFTLVIVFASNLPLNKNENRARITITNSLRLFP